MRQPTDERAGRFDVRSQDGTRLAVWVAGQGPPIVLVHGSLQDHTASAALARELQRDHTTFALDRRGFGASGDGPAHAIEREFEDTAAVVDAVSARTDQPVALWGHSYGAGCAMGAACLTTDLRALVLYEPSLGLAYPDGWVEEVERAVSGGDGETAIVRVLRDLLAFTDEQLDAMRADPTWPCRVATAPTVVREARAEQDWTYRPGQFDRVGAPTLLLAGSNSPPDVRRATMAAASAIPRARIRVLEGHAHTAHRTDPALVADVVRRFLRA